MKKHLLWKLLAFLLSGTMVIAILPFASLGGEAQAATETWTKTIAGISTSVIKAPAAPTNVSTPWKGSYVWYGKYNGAPVRYRVLAPKTTTYGGTTMLLDCDSVLYYAAFGVVSGSIRWENSAMKAGLNGGDFLTKSNGVTLHEKTAIASSKKANHKRNTGISSENYPDSWLNDYVGLTGEKVFLLDFEDVINPQYGYISDSGCELDVDFWWYECHEVENRIKKNTDGDARWWWLRSTGNDFDFYYPAAGEVGGDGAITTENVEECAIGVSPAFNVNLSSVIFSSVVSGSAGKDNAEYKLTLADSNLKVGIQSDKKLTASGTKITVPYTITGNDASNATQVSVLILDKTYTAGNTNNAKIKYYGKLDTGTATGFATTGTGTFTLPSGLSLSGWNSSYYVYLLAEDVNGIHESDYASTPLKLATPGYPNINTQPKSSSVAVGDTATFTVAATGKATLKYQWQYKAPGATSWTNSKASSAKTATLSFATTAGQNGYQFRCVITDGDGKQTPSSAVKLTVKPKITTQPKSVSVLVGNKATFTVAATGKATLKYQWQYKAPGATSWTDSKDPTAKTATLSFATKAGQNGYQFRCVVTDGNGTQNASSAAKLTVKPKITTQPKGTTVKAGSKATFTVAATGKATLKYQWQYKAPGATTWTDSKASSAKTATFSFTTKAGQNKYQFRCVVTDGNGNQTSSSAVTLTVNK